LNTIKIFIRTLQDRLKLRFYSRKKTYKVSYKINIQNKKDKTKQCSLIAPIPSATEYQKITDISIIPNPNTESEDATHKNKYVIWDFDLPEKGEKSFKIQFKAEIKPRKLTQQNETQENYLSPNKFIHSDNTKIKELAQKIVGNEENPQKKIHLLNEYVISKLKYGNPIKGLYPSNAALEKDCVDCGGYNTFLIAMLRAEGIPSRVVSGFWARYKNKKIKQPMHAWMEARLPNGKWIPLDPSSEQLFRQGRMWNSGRLGYTGSDRIEMSKGEDIILQNGFKTDILQNPIIICEGGKNDVSLDFEFRAQ
jgi:hypothetical protein